jgi:hypothetical protein
MGSVAVVLRRSVVIESLLGMHQSGIFERRFENFWHTFLAPGHGVNFDPVPACCINPQLLIDQGIKRFL